jgi:hypothetical protein
MTGGWDQHGAQNGMALPDSFAGSVNSGLPFHNGPHGNYTAHVSGGLDRLDIARNTNGWSPAQTNRILTRYANQLRSTIQNMGGGVRVD